MKKKLLIVITLLLVVFLTGCTEDEKVTLSNRFYNSNGVYIDIHSSDIEKYKNDNYILYVYNNFCNFTVPCDSIFKEFMEEEKIDFLSMPIDEYKKTNFYNKVKYAPTVMVIRNNKIVAYLDANSDKDLNKYQDTKEFSDWIKEYIIIKK